MPSAAPKGQTSGGNQGGNGNVKSTGEDKLGIWQRSVKDDVTTTDLHKFWDGLHMDQRRDLLRVDKQTLFEHVRKNMYCSRCHGLLVEGFAQIVVYGKNLQNGTATASGDLSFRSGSITGGVAPCLASSGDLDGGIHTQDDVGDPSVHPWGGLAATKDLQLTVMDRFLDGTPIEVFESARARERERELLYPDACGGGGRGWISSGQLALTGNGAGPGRTYSLKESCALHTARLSCEALVDFWSALGEETRRSLLRMKEEDFIERLMFRFESKRFCRDCRKNVLKEFKEMKELKRMRRQPRCTLWFCAADTAFRYEVSDQAVHADWHDCFLGDAASQYQRFEWAMGTAEGKQDILPFEDVGLVESVQVDGLDLLGRPVCFLTVRGWKRDGRCTELCCKAFALKGQLCVHRRLFVGDGYVSITKGESIQAFFERAEEAEEEDDEEGLDKDGNEVVDGDGLRPQKHAKSPELARDFLLDAATVIFKEQVEKAFREGTARQNAHSIFVCLALSLLEDRVRVACKEITAIKKQNELLAEEEHEKREEWERRERRKAKEKEKKLRRREKFKGRASSATPTSTDATASTAVASFKPAHAESSDDEEDDGPSPSPDLSLSPSNRPTTPELDDEESAEKQAYDIEDTTQSELAVEPASPISVGKGSSLSRSASAHEGKPEAVTDRGSPRSHAVGGMEPEPSGKDGPVPSRCTAEGAVGGIEKISEKLAQARVSARKVESGAEARHRKESAVPSVLMPTCGCGSPPGGASPVRLGLRGSAGISLQTGKGMGKRGKASPEGRETPRRLAEQGQLSSPKGKGGVKQSVIRENVVRGPTGGGTPALGGRKGGVLGPLEGGGAGGGGGVHKVGSIHHSYADGVGPMSGVLNGVTDLSTTASNIRLAAASARGVRPQGAARGIGAPVVIVDRGPTSASSSKVSAAHQTRMGGGGGLSVVGPRAGPVPEPPVKGVGNRTAGATRVVNSNVSQAQAPSGVSHVSYAQASGASTGPAFSASQVAALNASSHPAVAAPISADGLLRTSSGHMSAVSVREPGFAAASSSGSGQVNLSSSTASQAVRTMQVGPSAAGPMPSVYTPSVRPTPTPSTASSSTAADVMTDPPVARSQSVSPPVHRARARPLQDPPSVAVTPPAQAAPVPQRTLTPPLQQPPSVMSQDQAEHNGQFRHQPREQGDAGQPSMAPGMAMSFLPHTFAYYHAHQLHGAGQPGQWNARGGALLGPPLGPPPPGIFLAPGGMPVLPPGVNLSVRLAPGMTPPSSMAAAAGFMRPLPHQMPLRPPVEAVFLSRFGAVNNGGVDGMMGPSIQLMGHHRGLQAGKDIGPGGGGTNGPEHMPSADLARGAKLQSMGQAGVSPASTMGGNRPPAAQNMSHMAAGPGRSGVGGSGAPPGTPSLGGQVQDMSQFSLFTWPAPSTSSSPPPPAADARKDVLPGEAFQYASHFGPHGATGSAAEGAAEGQGRDGESSLGTASQVNTGGLQRTTPGSVLKQTRGNAGEEENAGEYSLFAAAGKSFGFLVGQGAGTKV